MLYRKLNGTGIEASVLGMGCMRLPVFEDNSIDESRAIDMIRMAIDGGVNYIDTAYPYHEKMSENLVGKALLDGYRERVNLVTKSPSWLIEEKADFMKYLDEQLEKLQTEHLEIYLLHAMNKERWEKMKECKVVEFIDEAKALGKIKNIGFSFHDDADAFKFIIDDYDKWDVCMVQFNIMDQDTQATLDGIKYAGIKKVPVIVMEPLKGGMLAFPSEDILEVYDQADEKKSPVEWAMRWAGQFPEIKVILSGMSTEEQIKENLEIAKRNTVASLTDAENQIVDQVREKYLHKVKVPCTDCKYCMPCPHGVGIPQNFRLLNNIFIYNMPETAVKSYNNFVPKEKWASNCVQCGICEEQCPQDIKIASLMPEVHKVLSGEVAPQEVF